MTLKLQTGPASEPVTLAEAKLHLRVDAATEDAYIGTLITVARQAAEHELQRALIEQTWDLYLDRFPFAEIMVPQPASPLRAVTSIVYLDTAGAEQTLAANRYTVDATQLVGWVIPALDTAWPDTLYGANAVRVRVTAGFGTQGAEVPPAIRHWMLTQIGHWYAAREAASERPLTPLPFLAGLLDPWRIVSI